MHALAGIDTWWRTASHLIVGQIHLQADARADRIAPRLRGHWHTSPRRLVRVHLNRLIRRNGVDPIDLAGPGHGGPAIVADE